MYITRLTKIVSNTGLCRDQGAGTPEFRFLSSDVVVDAPTDRITPNSPQNQLNFRR